jgi:hypothetical protein
VGTDQYEEDLYEAPGPRHVEQEQPYPASGAAFSSPGLQVSINFGSNLGLPTLITVLSTKCILGGTRIL